MYQLCTEITHVILLYNISKRKPIELLSQKYNAQLTCNNKFKFQNVIVVLRQLYIRFIMRNINSVISCCIIVYNIIF
jgi:hypothetical protein